VETTHLFDLPHVEASRLVKTGAPVYLTVNPVEYHGPHLSLHNDRLISQKLIELLHTRLASRHPDWPLLSGGDLEIGVEPCQGPGSRHTRFEVAREIVQEACRAVAELGSQRVVIMTFHGSPLHNLAIEEGIDLLREKGVRAVAPFNYVLRSLVELDDPAPYAAAFAHVPDPAEREEMLHGITTDFHAGFFETSVALRLVPHTVSEVYKRLPPCPPIKPDPALDLAAKAAAAVGRSQLARELGFAAEGKGWNAMRPFYGYTGRPAHATAESGDVFVREILNRYEEGVESVLAGESTSPEPILKWVAAVSLNGRLAGLHVPLDQIFQLPPA
jgi:creatinine amidohydrolase